MTRKFTLILLSFFIIILSACTNNKETAMTDTPTPPPSASATPTPTDVPPKPLVGYTPVPADTLSPSVIQRYPQRGENVQPDDAIELVFDRDMNPDAVQNALSVHLAGETAPIDGNLIWVNNRTAQFKAATPLPRAATFDVILTQDAVADTGEPLREPYTFRFQSAGYLDVAQVIPAPGTVDAEAASTITVMFNRPVVPLTSLAQMEDLPNPVTFEPKIAGTGEWLNTLIYVFTPEKPLTGGVRYTATVAAGLADISGAVLADDFSWQFSVIPPQVTWVSPRDGDTLVDINTPISVKFNQPVDFDSAKENFSMTAGGLLGTSAVKGNFAMVGNTLTFTPTKALDFDKTYTLNLNAGIVAAPGAEGMREAMKWKFTTVPLPKIVSTTPKNGERHASPRTSFEIEFNTRINPDTMMQNVTFTPELSPAQVYTYFSEYNNTFTINFEAQPSSDYQVVIDKGIADPYGNTIPKGATVKFRTDAFEPNYQLVTAAFIATYDASQPARAVIGHINVNRVDLKLYQLPQDVLQNPMWQLYNYQYDELKGANLLRSWKEALESPLNKKSYTPVNLTEADGTLSPGIYLLETTSPDLPKDYPPQRHVLIVSDLNLMLKVGAKEMLVWATDLATGAPAPNLTLNVREDNALKGSLTTDADGIARMTLNQNRGSIVVFSDSPFVAASQDWGRGISPWDFGMGSGIAEQDFRTHLYTDRAIYRAGQKVNFKGIIRAENDAVFRLPDVGSVNVTIMSADYQEIFNQSLPVSALGTFNAEITLDENAPLGQYNISMNFNNSYAETYFQVAAYRPPEFEVTVETEPPAIQRGDNLNADIAAKYFFGGGLADTPVSWNITESRYSFSVPWAARYSFDDVDDPYACYHCWWWQPPTPHGAILEGSDTTDAKGLVSVVVDGTKLSDALTQHASQITFEANASGPDNQNIAGRTSVIVHPGAWYTGLAPQRYVSYAEKPANIDLVTVDWDGNRLANKALKIEVYQREWENTFIEYDGGGGGYWDWKTKDTLVETLSATTDERGEAIATFTPPTGGSYHIIATPAEPTAAEAHIRSSIFIWVTGKGNVSWRRDNNDRITLISDQTTYRVGDTAEILIPSPFEGEQYALISIERAGILRYEVLKLENNSTVYQLPITEADLPNIYFSAVLIKGRAEDALADFKMGLLPLDVNLDPKTLVLNIETDADVTEPGDDVTYTVTAADTDGNPVANAEFSLDVVDKAVLNLQPRTDDILSAFYGRRALGIQTSSGLSISGDRYLKQLAQDLDLEVEPTQEEGMRDFAAGAAMDEAMPIMEMAAEAPMPAAPMAKSAANIAPPEGVEIREDFADTAFWQAAVVTDADGKASITLTLPDNLTTWVLRGVGVTADTLVGEGTADLMATKALLIRPVTPRFFVVDDRAELAANVSNNTDRDLETKVSLAAEGIGISTETPPLQKVTIPAHSETKVTWDVTVNDVTETQLVFAAVSGEYSDASKPRLSTAPDGALMVYRYTAPNIVGTAGQLTEGGSVTEAIALPPEFDDRRGQLSVQLDASLAAGMQDGLKYLEHFEYECTEQTVSRFLPNVLTWHALQSLGIDNPELSAKLPGQLDTGLEKLYKEQNPDGGWGWWYRADDRWQSNAHISGYVVFALLKAQQTGIQVSDTVLMNGINYLKSQIQSVNDYRHYRNANQQAWLLYVLAEGDAAPSKTLDDLFNNRDKLSHYARAYLAQALWLQNANDGRLQTLLSDLNNATILSATGAHWEEDNYDWWAMNTDTRSTAIILDTLTKLDPENALNPNVVRWLMVARKAGIWETTQETAWALISLTDWMLETGELDANYDFTAYLNDAEIANDTATRDTVQDSVKVSIPVVDLLADALNTLTIARTDGTGRLYYTAHLEVYQPVENLEPVDRGISVQRRYSLADCTDGSACPDVREAKLGDVIRVDLTIIAPNDLYYVMVEDPLPAGGEAIDTGLATTSLLAMGPTLSREDSRYWWWWHWYSRSELRDEKVVLFADVLSKGTYEYSYTFRATLPGDFHVIPTVAKEMYFPEVFGRSDGRLLSIGK